MVVEPQTDELRDLFWQDELTEAMSWLITERRAAQIDSSSLADVLWTGATVEPRHLEQLVDAGLARRSADGGYVLTEHGKARGSQLLMAEAREFLQPADCCSAGAGASSCCGPRSTDVDCGCCGGDRMDTRVA